MHWTFDLRCLIIQTLSHDSYKLCCVKDLWFTSISVQIGDDNPHASCWHSKGAECGIASHETFHWRLIIPKARCLIIVAPTLNAMVRYLLMALIINTWLARDSTNHKLTMQYYQSALPSQVVVWIKKWSQSWDSVLFKFVVSCNKYKTLYVGKHSR